MDENYEVNYAGVIYKNGDKVKFIEKDIEFIGNVRFGLYWTYWMNPDTLEINRHEHLGWVVDYNITNVSEDEKSWKENQQTLGDAIMDFDGVLFNE